MPRTILFCGGGSLGHVIPSIAVREVLLERDASLRCHFICSARPSEGEFLRQCGAPYSVLHAPKFPRAISFHLFTFPFLFLVACIESLTIILSVKPAVVFTKGGFVSVPPAVVSWILRIPVVLHMSDIVPSLSDRIISSFASTICSGFPKNYLPSALQRRAIETGNPVRRFVATGSKERGLALTGFTGRRPIVLVMGGSQGARSINEAIDKSFESIVAVADVAHLTGEKKALARKDPRYAEWPILGPELPDLYACADLVVTRAGAGALSELSAAAKACIVLPLCGVAHDHQAKNAAFLQSRDAAEVIDDSPYDSLAPLIVRLLGDPVRRRVLAENIRRAFPFDAAASVATILLDMFKQPRLES